MNDSHVFCSKCGSRNAADDLFCSKCGASLAPAPPPPPPPTAVPTPPVMPTYQAPPKRSNLPLFVAIGAIFLLLVVIVIEGVIILLPRGAVQELGATLSVLEGEASVERGGQTEWIEVGEEFIVQAGDRIRVPDASHALLTFVEDTTTELRSLTELRITELEAVGGQRVVIRLDLELGEIWNRIAALPGDSLHEVTTVAARVTSKGTEYGMAVNQTGTTWVTGKDGRPDVDAAGQTVQLAPGETLVVELGSAPVSYREVAVAPAPPVVQGSSPVSITLESADLPTFLNEPLPTGTPTNTPTATATRRPATATPTATSTRRPQPSPTTPVCPPNCPTFRINVPAGAPPYGVFGIEWDVLYAPVPAGYSYVLEFSQDQASWGRTPPLTWKDAQGQGELWEQAGHMNAEIRGAGPGNWYWRVCIVRTETGPSCCCGPSHVIVHARDGGDDHG